MKHYKIVKGNTSVELEQKVEALLNAGWITLSPLFYGCGQYCQPMFKEDPPGVKKITCTQTLN